MRSLDGFGGLLGRIILEKGKVWFTGTQEDRLSLLYAQNKTKKSFALNSQMMSGERIQAHA